MPKLINNITNTSSIINGANTITIPSNVNDTISLNGTAQTITATKTFSVNTKFTTGGNSTPANAGIYYLPTAISQSGTNSYYYTYLDTPPNTDSSTGTSSILYINTEASNVSNSYSLYCNGKSLFAGVVRIINDFRIEGQYYNVQIPRVKIANTAFNNTPDYTSGVHFGINNITFTDSTTVASSTIALAPMSRFRQTTLAATSLSVTATNASTVYIDGAPISSTNMTFTNAYSLYIAAGKLYSGGTLQIPTGASNGYVLTSDANGNASWAAAATGGTFSDGTVSLPGIAYTSETSTGFYRIGAGNVALSLTGAKYVDFSTTTTQFLNTLSPIKAGSSTASSASLYSNPASTALSGSNDYYFNYFNTPTTSSSTTGTASTVYIAGAPAGATTSYALNVAAGITAFNGPVITIPQTITGTTTPQTLSATASNLIICNTTATITLNLPASPSSGQQFTIINTANYLIYVTITAGSTYFDGDGSTVEIILSQHDRLQVLYYNSAWYSL